MTGKDLISRDSLERIIKRAAELQAGERDIGEGLTTQEVLALGKDVGIPNRYLQQALLEEQTRSIIDAQTGFWAWLTGPRTLAAHRVVPGDRPAVEAALTRWLQEEESLQVKRRYPDRTTWEPRAGAVASIQRALGARGRRYALAGAAEITGQVTQLEPGFCHVTLSADIRPRRGRRISGAALLTGVGALATATFVTLLGAIGFVAAAILLPVAIGVARHHRTDNERIQISLEQVLDRLERNEIRDTPSLPGPHPIFRIAEEFRKVLDNPRPRPRGR